MPKPPSSDADDAALDRYAAALEHSTEGTDRLMSEELIIFMVDCSSSMDGPLDPIQKVKKIDAARKGLHEFLRQRIEHQKANPRAADQVAVVTFPSIRRDYEYAQVLLQPSLPHAGHLTLLDSLIAHGGTPLTYAIRATGELIQYSGSGLIRLVIISDGQPDDKTQSINLASGLVAEFGVVIDTVGVGPPGGHDYDEKFLRELARIGDGKFLHISDLASFVQFLLNSEVERRALLGAGMLLLPPAPTK